MTQFLLIIRAFSSVWEMGSAILSVKDWSVSFSKFNVLSKVHLTVLRGEIFGIIGVSGVGKTTLLSSFTTVLKPDSGVLMFDFGDGLKLIDKKNVLAYKSLIGFSSQEGSFYPELSVFENLRYFASLYSVKDVDKRVSEVLKLVDLLKFKDAKASKLSGGMQKRLDIACAIIHKPKLLLLDEPTADLDPMMRNHIWDIIHKINREGTTIIVASHFLDELEKSCDSLAMIHNKRLILLGSVSKLHALYSNNKEVHIKLRSTDYPALLSHLKSSNLSIKRIAVVNGELVVLTSDLDGLIRNVFSVLNPESLQSISVNEPSVKEVFETLVNSGFDLV